MTAVSSIGNVRFDVVTEDCHLAGFAMTRDALLCPANEGIKLRFRRSILL